MKKYVKIYDKSFILDEDAKAVCKEIDLYPKFLNDVYESCSYEKRRIWNKWFDWVNEAADYLNTNKWKFKIKSHNSSYFSLVMTIETKTKKYYFFITYAHNYAWIEEK